MGEASEADRITGEPKPYRIGVVRRLHVWRLGRQDGRRGVPDPMSEHPPLTTQARKDLELDFTDAALGLRVQLLTSTEELRHELRMLEARLPSWRLLPQPLSRNLGGSRTIRQTGRRRSGARARPTSPSS
jgi:hypothetical protein